MYGRRDLRFIIGFGVVIVLVIIALVIILGHHPVTHHQRPLESYTNDPTAQIAMLIDGPVNAESKHNQVQVFINNTGTTINTFRGYNDQVINSKHYYLSVNGFHVLLRSLAYAGFMEGNSNPQLSEASGYCPTGNTYIFSLDDNGKQLQRYWTTDCGGTHTYNGDFQLTLSLFEAQVPDYSSLTSNLNL